MSIMHWSKPLDSHVETTPALVKMEQRALYGIMHPIVITQDKDTNEVMFVGVF